MITTGLGHCGICQQPMRETALVDHVTTNHPGRLELAETWPDGRAVVVDLTLTPREFGAPHAG